jgi:hypothetical protein
MKEFIYLRERACLWAAFLLQRMIRQSTHAFVTHEFVLKLRLPLPVRGMGRFYFGAQSSIIKAITTASPVRELTKGTCSIYPAGGKQKPSLSAV